MIPSSGSIGENMSGFSAMPILSENESGSVWFWTGSPKTACPTKAEGVVSTCI